MLSPIVDRIDRYLSLLTLRQQITAANIANVDTPGYKTRDIDFQSELARASGTAASIEVPALQMKNDGNNVSLDREGRMLAESALKFGVGTQLLQTQIRMARTAIQDGK